MINFNIDNCEGYIVLQNKNNEDDLIVLEKKHYLRVHTDVKRVLKGQEASTKVGMWRLNVFFEGDLIVYRLIHDALDIEQFALFTEERFKYFVDLLWRNITEDETLTYDEGCEFADNNINDVLTIAIEGVDLAGVTPVGEEDEDGDILEDDALELVTSSSEDTTEEN